jgi:hypothetical protein
MKVYQLEYYDIEEKKWQTVKYCTNLKKAYELAEKIAAPPTYSKIYRSLLPDEESEPESLDSKDYAFTAKVIDQTPTAYRIDDMVKLRISRHHVV